VIGALTPPWGRADRRCLAVLVAVAVGLWLPRLRGPLDLRYDAGVYYVLGTSLAEGRGYRLLNEPGAIQAVQYPPLLPVMGALAERVLGTDDPAVVGHWLRLGSVLLYAGYAVAIHVMARRFLAPGYAFLTALLAVVHSHTVFLSDFFAADVPYAFVGTLFFAVGGGPAAGLLAIAAYGLRTAGVALLAAWVAERLLRRRVAQAVARGAVAAVAVLAWQAYTRHVRAGAEFAQPAYPYQRAGYQFYNVSYADNMAYVDPFRPELGRVSGAALLARLAANLREIPMTLGEGVSVHRGWWHGEVDKLNQRLSGSRIPQWPADAAMLALCLPVIAGLVLLARRGAVLLVLYAAGSLLLIALTPWPGQFVRYMVPLTPFLTLAVLALLAECSRWAAATNARRWHAARIALVGVVAVIGLQQVLTLARSMLKYPSPASVTDRAGVRHEYRLFFYDRTWRLHDDGLDWLAHRARPGEIVATSAPQWSYLRTGLQSVMPPYEAEPIRAAALLDSVPVTYLIVDQLAFLDVGRRYTIPAIRSAPDRWRLIYAVSDSGPRIYRRVGGSAK
jgi:hypothetical protein